MVLPPPWTHAQAAKRQRQRRQAWSCWSVTSCPRCGQAAGAQCVVLADDTRFLRHRQPGDTRPAVHQERWRAYMDSLSREQRQELAQAQERKQARQRQWPHV